MKHAQSMCAFWVDTEYLFKQTEADHILRNHSKCEFEQTVFDGA